MCCLPGIQGYVTPPPPQMCYPRLTDVSPDGCVPPMDVTSQMCCPLPQMLPPLWMLLTHRTCYPSPLVVDGDGGIEVPWTSWAKSLVYSLIILSSGISGVDMKFVVPAIPRTTHTNHELDLSKRLSTEMSGNSCVQFVADENASLA